MNAETRARATGTDVTLDEQDEDRVAARLARHVPRPLARFLAVQWVIARSALGGSPAPHVVPGARSRVFGYAVEGSMKMILLTYPLLVAGDALVLWAVLPRHLAWVHAVVAGLSAYGFVWLLGVYRTMVARPHVLDGAHLRLHRGILGSARVPLADVASTETLPEGDEKIAGEPPLRLDFGGRRVMLVLRRPVRTRGALRVVVSADEPEALRRALEPAAEPA